MTVAVLLAAGITILLLPSLNKLLKLSLSFNILSDPSIVLFLLAVMIVVTALAGFYPSVILSRFNPINALKSQLSVNALKGISLRRGLVVFQFIVAQAFIIGTLIIMQQINYFMNRPLGFAKDAVVNIPYRPDSTGGKLADYLRQHLLSVNGVQAVSFSSHTPVEDDNDMWTTFRFDKASKDENFKAITKFADHAYVPAYTLKLIAGRNLQSSDPTKEVLVNDSLVQRLGFENPEDILNKKVSLWDGLIKCPVVRVLKDFDNRSFRHSIAPLLKTTNITMYRKASVKLATANITSTIAAIEERWVKTFPNYVYEYRFLDEKIDNF